MIFLRQQKFFFVMSTPSPSQSHSFIEDDSTASFLVSRRRLAFKPPTLFSKRTTVASSVSTDKTENTFASVVTSTSKAMALECIASSSKCTNATSAETVDKTRRMYWTFEEQSIFYEALKMHGKDFDAISKFMLKKKFNKDKDQVRNYYMNTFKVWKYKAQIEDADWENIPRDARELFVLLNGFEWRKRLKGLSFDEKKFRQLVMDGYSSFRPKRKKFIVNLKTPYCPALLKYFPYNKRNCEIPQYLSVKLKPLRNQDREYVVTNEQNPFLMVQINVNDKISSLFDFLKRKWLLHSARKRNASQINNYGSNSSSVTVGIRLFVGESNQVIHNVLIGNESASPLLSLTKLKRDFSPIQCTEMGGDSACAGRQPNDIKLSASSVKEVFEINKDKIQAGLTESEVGNASMLQLFYMLGMKKELSFSYQIYGYEPKFHSWTVFKSLVARDYDELMAKSIATTDAANIQSGATTINNNTYSDVFNGCVSPLAVEAIPVQNRRFPCTRNVTEIGIVEQENALFVEQLKAQCNTLQPKRPKRQIKLIPDTQTKFMRITAHSSPKQQQQLVNDGVLTNQHLYAGGTTNSPLPVGEVSSNHHLARVEHHSPAVILGTATDFSVFQGFPPAESHHIAHFNNCNTQIVPAAAVPSSTSATATNTVIELSDFSMDSSATISQFHPIVLDSSPNKSLPEDVRTACEQMLKENSVDYCRQFEQLANLHNDGSPIKTFDENKH